MRRLLLMLFFSLAAGAGAQVAIQPAPAGRTTPLPATGKKVHPANAGPSDGHALFGEKCAMCHGPDGMGTGLLARRMDPKVAQLEKRTDLSADYIKQAVRTGIGNMPWISRGEVSDRQLSAISAYLAKGNK